tara:strand:+ start:70 stop:477 length:408 start_codon:yes stop_codon:yes gene_type:complete
MKKVQNLKCPCCGYIYNQTYNASKEIERLIAKRNKSTKDILRKVFLLINKNIPSDRDRDLQYKFLQAISNVGEIAIKWSVNRYIMDNHYLSGKGLAYLKNIILNHNKNNKVMSKNERRSKGMSPKIINLERKTND